MSGASGISLNPLSCKEQGSQANGARSNSPQSQVNNPQFQVNSAQSDSSVNQENLSSAANRTQQQCAVMFQNGQKMYLRLLKDYVKGMKSFQKIDYQEMKCQVQSFDYWMKHGGPLDYKEKFLSDFYLKSLIDVREYERKRIARSPTAAIKRIFKNLMGCIFVQPVTQTEEKTISHTKTSYISKEYIEVDEDTPLKQQ